MVQEYDLHGKTVNDSTRLLEELINFTRISSSTLEIKFITGRGKIQENFLNLVKFYDLEYSIPLSNTGVITVYIS